MTSNPGVPSGSFIMTGSFNAKGVTLSPVKWLVAPAGYEMVGLSGVTPGFKGVNTFRGSVSVPGCATFLLHRLAVAPDEAAAAGKWKGAYACAQGLSGLTLTIKPGKTVDTTMHTLTATFALYPVKGNPGAPSGSYSTKGYYFPGGIDLEPGQWISKPSVYGMDAIIAVPPAAGGKRLKGVTSPAPAASTWRSPDKASSPWWRFGEMRVSSMYPADIRRALHRLRMASRQDLSRRRRLLRNGTRRSLTWLDDHSRYALSLAWGAAAATPWNTNCAASASSRRTASRTRPDRWYIPLTGTERPVR